MVLGVYRATEAWPKREQYGLISQARRAAFSVAANITEGSAKRGPRELRRFLDISLGSFAELRYILRLAQDLGYHSAESGQALEPLIELAGRLLWGLYRSIRA